MFLKVFLKLGEKLQMWVNKLQIAIIEKNTDNIDNLLDNMPKFRTKEEMISAQYLLREALELLYTLKDETALTMKQLKKSIDFLKSTEYHTSNRLDIRS